MRAAQRLLKSPVVDLLLGPHGIDRYLELIDPTLTVNEARAEVVEVRHQTPRSVTLRLRPNAAFAGFRAGQFVRVGVDIDAVRRTRTYSPASSAFDDVLELTITAHPHGLVSRHLSERARPGAVLHLGRSMGSFVLPEPRPDHLLLIGGGSGITPVMSMLRTLADEGRADRVDFLHFARTERDFLYRDELRRLLGSRARFIATREGGSHVDAAMLQAFDGATAAVCGPSALLAAVQADWRGPLLTETFTPLGVSAAASGANGTSGAAARGRLRFINTDKTVPIAPGTLLEQAEAAGLAPEFGCRMGICHTCTCRKLAGAVRNVRTGEVSDEEDEDIQLCISVPEGDIALEL